MSLDPVARISALSAVSRNAIVAQASPAAAVVEGVATRSANSAPNPSLRLDPELGIVVMEFRSTPGVAARTIPSSQELEAYRLAARTGAPKPGELPEPQETSGTA